MNNTVIGSRCNSVAKRSPRSQPIKFVGEKTRVYLLLICLVLGSLYLVSCAEKPTSLPVVASTPAETILASSLTIESPTSTETATASPTSTPTPTFHVTLDAVGDIMLARTVGDQILAEGPQIVFSGVQSVLSSADVRVGNLECAITERNTPEEKSFPLKAPLQAAQALALAEFDVLSLANNHAMDYGFAGLSDTQAALTHSGIATVGAGLNVSAAHAPVVIEKNGLRLAFLAYADVVPEKSGFDTKNWIATQSQPGIAWADPELIKADVSAAKLQADLVVVMLHSGYEINTAVSPDQQMEAHAAIDAGAALVIGSHPHILQTVEQYHGGLVAYSLGNFVFDEYLGIVNATVILRVVLDHSGVVSHDYIPVLIENGLPVVTSIDNVRGIETLVAPVNP
jgi:poly-gamma-glutamate capsule biosynthesis protein CapA/YwtB (metallophosphatase superfamily)